MYVCWSIDDSSHLKWLGFLWWCLNACHKCFQWSWMEGCTQSILWQLFEYLFLRTLKYDQFYPKIKIQIQSSKVNGLTIKYFELSHSHWCTLEKVTSTAIISQYSSMLTKVIFIFAHTSFKQKSTSGTSNYRRWWFCSIFVVIFGYAAPTNMTSLHYLSAFLASK